MAPNVYFVTFLCIFVHSSRGTRTEVGLPNFPSLNQFLKGPPDSVSGEFTINAGCSATIALVDTSYQASFTPPDCLNLGALVHLIDREGKGNFDMGSDFMVLDHIIIRTLSFDTSSREVDIAASYSGTVPIVPGMLSISNINMQVTYISSHSDNWKFDISAKINIGTLGIDVSLIRNEEGYFMSASSQANITLTDIVNMFQTSNSILPDDGLKNELTEANMDSFAIETPRIKAVLTDGYGFLFGGKVRILEWKPIDVNVLINKPNDGLLSVTIAIYTPEFSIADMFNDLFKIDISSVPVIGTATIKNLALIISTQDVNTPLALLDIGYSDMFDIPYERGIKVMCELQISGKSVSLSLKITETQFSFTVGNPGGLTLRNILDEFLAEHKSTIISTDSGETKLNNWPEFIEFDPLAIALAKLAIEARNDESTWSMSSVSIKLIMTEPIILFDNKITISDLSFEMNWQKGNDEQVSAVSGVIQGSVTIGSTEGEKSPKADIRITFPFSNQKITFKFNDFSVNSILTTFGVEIPTDHVFSFLTQIQLDRIALSFGDNNELNNVSVECSLPRVWPVFGSISIGNMKLSVTVDNMAGETSGGNKKSDQASGRTWAFSISGHVIISSCDIEVSSTIGSESIQVEGRGTNCDISIAHLLNAISVNPDDFPQFISGFTFSEPAALFHYDRTNNNKAIGFGATTNLFGSSDAEIALISKGSTTAIVAGFAVQNAASVPEISFLSDLGLTDIAVIYVSSDVTLDPYSWRKDIFNEFAPTTKQLDSGLMIKAKFEPSDENLMGRLLKTAGKATVEVSLTLPDLVFTLDIEMPDGGIPLGEDSAGKFVSMGLVISKRLIGLNLRFSLQLEDHVLIFTGELSFTFGGTVTISLLMEGRWERPFGIEGFAINRLGLALGINVVTLFPSFGLTGDIEVTPVDRTTIQAGLTICVDTANPLSTVFEIHFSRLLLADIVNLFLNRNVGLPTKVGEMGFPEEVRIFFSPAGNDRCFGKSYPAGVEIHGTFQIPFLQVYARADIVIGFEPFKLVADLRLHPINYGNGLLKIVSAESDEQGPFLIMNIGDADSFLIDGSCKIVLFGASISISLTINKEKLHFKGELNLWNLFRISLEVELVYGTTSPSLRVKGEMQNDLFDKIKTRASEAIRRGARKVNEKIEGAQSKIRNAQREVDKLQESIDWHKRQIQNAKNECSRAPWYRKWVCIGTAGRIIYHGVVIGGIYVAKGVATAVLAAADLFLEGVKGLINISAELLVTLVNAVLSIIDIKYIKFDLHMTATRKTFEFESKIVVAGEWTLTPSFTINFSNSETAEEGINSAGDSISKETMDNVEQKFSK